MTPRISPLLAVALLATLFVDCAPEIGGPPVPRRRGEDDLPRPRYARACSASDLEAAVTLARHLSLTRWEQALLLTATHHASPYEAEVLRTEVAGGVVDVRGYGLAWIRAGFGRRTLRRAVRETAAGAWSVGVGEAA